MVKHHSITGIAACLAVVAFIASCGNDPKPVAPAGEPAPKIAHPRHDADNAVVEDLSNDREIMAAATQGRGDNALWGYIDKQGQWVIPPRANSTGSWQRNRIGFWVFVRAHAGFTGAAAFSDGLAAVREVETGLVGFIDNQGQWVIEPQFDGLTASRETETGLIGFTDNRGEWRFGPRPQFISEDMLYGSGNGLFVGHAFSMGLAAAYDPALGRNGFIDKSGAWAIDPQFPVTMGPFAERLAPVYSGSRGLGWSYEEHNDCGYISQAGNWAFEPQFIRCGSFYHGLAAVAVKRGEYTLWGYINVDNEWVIEPQFYRAERFSDGLARVRLDREHVAYIDMGGQFVIGPEHQDHYCGGNCRFVEGLAAQKDETDLWGYIDKSGAWVIEPQFTDALPFSEGLAVVRASGEYGYIDKSGAWVIEPQFEQALPFTRTTP